MCCQDAYLTICILASEDQLYFPASSLLAGSFFIPAVIIRPRCASQGNDAAAWRSCCQPNPLVSQIPLGFGAIWSAGCICNAGLHAFWYLLCMDLAPAAPLGLCSVGLGKRGSSPMRLRDSTPGRAVRLLPGSTYPPESSTKPPICAMCLKSTPLCPLPISNIVLQISYAPSDENSDVSSSGPSCWRPCRNRALNFKPSLLGSCVVQTSLRNFSSPNCGQNDSARQWEAVGALAVPRSAYPFCYRLCSSEALLSISHFIIHLSVLCAVLCCTVRTASIAGNRLFAESVVDL